MTNQTHAQLRERIAALIDEHVIAVSMSDSWLEGQEEAADAILALLSPPDTGLASVVSDKERLTESLQESSALMREATQTIKGLRQALTTGGSGWRPEVRAFADLMEAQLRKNDHKPGWKNDRPHSLLKRLYDEAAELGHAMPYDDDFEAEVVGLEAADVANFAMMIADVCGALPAPPGPKGGA